MSKEGFRKDSEMFERIFKDLQKFADEKRRMPLSKFRRYAPLFQKEDRTPEELNYLHMLSGEYITEIDPYCATEIYDDVTGEVVLKLPAVFMRTKDIPADDTLRKMSIEVLSVEDRTENQAKIRQDYANLTRDFVNSQNFDVKKLAKIRAGITILSAKVLKTSNPKKYQELVGKNTPTENTTTQQPSSHESMLQFEEDDD